MPLVLEMNFNVEAKSIYELAFGPNSTNADTHQRNYKCTESLVDLVMSIVNRFIQRLKRVIEARTQAYKISVAKERAFRRWHKRHTRRSITATIEERQEIKTAITKRSIGAWMTGLSVLTLVSQVSSSVYFGVKVSSLSNYIASVEQQVEISMWLRSGAVYF